MNVKAGAIVGGGAFVLSFFAGLFARNAFVTVFIRALVFAFIFCGLYFLISFLFSKFLSEMSSQDLADKDEQPKVPLTGGKVDLVIQDENLENEETGPKFVLKDGKSFDEEEIPVNKEVAIAPDAQKNSVEDGVLQPKSETPESSFKPMDFSNAEKIQTASPPEKKETVSSDDVDTLPDIGDLNFGEKNSSIDDIIVDSDFASSEGNSPVSSGKTFQNDTMPSIENADVMARAIQTLLAKY